MTHHALVAVAADDPRCLLAVGRWVRDATMLADDLPAHRLLRRMSARLAVEPQGTVDEALLELTA